MNAFERAANSAEWRDLSERLRIFFQRNFNDWPAYLIIPFSRLPEGKLPLAMVNPGQPSPSHKGIPKYAPYHTSDYQLVSWHGERWNFSPKQRIVVRVLWEAWEAGRPEVSQRELLDAAESECDSLLELFKKDNRPHPAMGNLIKRVSPTVYRLAFPTPEEEPPADPDEIGEDSY